MVITAHKTYQRDNISDLNRITEDMIANGWQPYGNVVVVDCSAYSHTSVQRHYQTFVMYEEKVGEELE